MEDRDELFSLSLSLSLSCHGLVSAASLLLPDPLLSTWVLPVVRRESFFMIETCLRDVNPGWRKKNSMSYCDDLYSLTVNRFNEEEKKVFPLIPSHTVNEQRPSALALSDP